jgi:hypothetical protein
MLTTEEKRRRYDAMTPSRRWFLAARHRKTQVVHAMVSTIAVFAMAIVWGVGVTIVIGPIWAWMLDSMPMVFVGVGTIVYIGPFLAGVTVAARWSMRTCAMREIGRTTCPVCGYSLMGLNVAEGRVTCPECGGETELDEFAILPQDLETKCAA